MLFITFGLYIVQYSPGSIAFGRESDQEMFDRDGVYGPCRDRAKYVFDPRPRIRARIPRPFSDMPCEMLIGLGNPCAYFLQPCHPLLDQGRMIQVVTFDRLSTLAVIHLCLFFEGWANTSIVRKGNQ